MADERESATDAVLSELIHRRRRQILLCSILYYRYDRSLVSDDTFDSWCRQLVELQHDYPRIAASVADLDDAFRGFHGTSGFDLPLDDPESNWTATFLMRSLA